MKYLVVFVLTSVAGTASAEWAELPAEREYSLAYSTAVEQGLSEWLGYGVRHWVDGDWALSGYAGYEGKDKGQLPRWFIDWLADDQTHYIEDILQVVRQYNGGVLDDEISSLWHDIAAKSPYWDGNSLGEQGGSPGRWENAANLADVRNVTTHPMQTAIGVWALHVYTLDTALMVVAAGQLGVGIVRYATGPSAVTSLVHLTDDAGRAAIEASQKIVGEAGIYALPAGAARQGGVLRFLRSLVLPSRVQHAIPVPEAATAAFSRPWVMGPFSLWQRLVGARNTAPGFIDLATGSFVQTFGKLDNQLKIYAFDVVVDVLAGFAGAAYLARDRK